MTNSLDSKEHDHLSFDPAIQSENIAFSPSELLMCQGCSRQNPPNRINCIYCGKELKFREEDVIDRHLVSRQLEAWEAGFNIIFRSASNGCDLMAATKLLGENIDLTAIVAAGNPVPIARVDSLKLAEILVTKMLGSGVVCSIVSDADLDAERPPIRLSKIEIADDLFFFTDFNTRSSMEIANEDLTLIVTGQLNRTRTDLIEKRKRKGSELLDESASFTDELIVDLYTRNEPRGFRIYPAGFDFSCLGQEKGILARENIERLVTYLSSLASNARFVSSYSAARPFLARVWEVESRTDAQGIKRIGFGKRGFGKTESTSNLQQFTKYSRLQRHLL